jgi:ribonuclease HI
VRVYTDGACLGNPGPGGWAWAVSPQVYGSGGEPWTTNQRMELRAVIEAVRSNDAPMVVVTDSKYVFSCFSEGWWQRWVSNGFRTAAKKPVANEDLWRELIGMYLQLGDGMLSFEWVKGHGDDELNALVDRLARAQAASWARRGLGSP